MNKKLTIALLLFFAVAYCVMLLTRKGGVEQYSTDKEDTALTPVLPNLQLRTNYRRLSITTGRGDQNMELLFDSKGWQVESPCMFPADRKQINDLMEMLANLEGVKSNHPFPENSTPAINLKDNHHPYLIRLGSRRGSGKGLIHIYEQIDGSETSYITDDSLHDYMEQFNKAAYYANRPILPLVTDVVRITFKTPDDQSTLIQRDGSWQIGDGEKNERVLTQSIDDAIGINDFFQFIANLDLSGLQDHTTPLSAFGLSDPLITIKMFGLSPLTFGDNTFEIKIGTPADSQDQMRFISIRYDNETPPPVFTIPTQQALLLGQAASSFRDPRLITTSVSMISSIMLLSDKDSVEAILLDKGAKPLLGQQDNDLFTALSITRVTDALKRLSDARAIDYVLIDQDDNLELLRIATIKPKLDGKEEIVLIYADPENDQENPTVMVRRGEESVLLRMPKNSVVALLDPTILIEDNE